LAAIRSLATKAGGIHRRNEGVRVATKPSVVLPLELGFGGCSTCDRRLDDTWRPLLGPAGDAAAV
jgi:hypothetical protein